MKQEHMDEIKSHYDKAGVFKRNERYSGEQGTVCTRDKAVMRKLDTLVIVFPDIYKLITETDIDKTYEMPKSHVNYRKPRKLTQEQREQARQRMERMRKQSVDLWKWK